MYINKPLSEYIDDLASDKSSPGGGSVAAITGVQAISLVVMVARLTLGKKKYVDVQDEIKEIIEKAEAIRSSLTQMIDEDIVVFGEVMEAYSIPKEEREAPLKAALKKSGLFSFSMFEDCYEVVKLAQRVAEIGNTNVISDSAIAIMLGISAMRSSRINVLINLESLGDEALLNELVTTMEDQLTKFDWSALEKNETLKNYTKGGI